MSSNPHLSTPTRRAALLGLMALGGCGLTPVFGTGGAAFAMRNAIAIDTPQTIAGFRLGRRLNNRLGAANAPQFRLTATLSQSSSAATISRDGDTTRITLTGISEWSLTDITGTTTLITDTTRSITSYSATGSTVATEAAKNDAEKRLSLAIADHITNRLVMFFDGATR